MKERYINVEFNSDFSIKQKIVIQSAARFWSDIVEGTQESINPDGLEINFSIKEIDGLGGVLAQASPFPSILPNLGFIFFDKPDLEILTEDNQLLGVVKHEIGHILGFGTLWIRRRVLWGKWSDDPVFTGKKASREYADLIGSVEPVFVPVENTGAVGTINSHWRETVFKNELMTGYANHGEVLSRVTVASLKDLGYRVSYDYCDEFSLH